MKLLHLANFGSTNVGNGALIYGTERVISEDFPEEVIFTRVPWDDYIIEGVPGPKKFDQDFVDHVNMHDALLVGGAVMFREDHIRFKMPFEMHKPVIFYGVSYRVWGDGPYYTGVHFGFDITRTLSYPKCIFGVRNDGTEQWLWSKLGWHSEKVESIPDPGLYIDPVDIRHPVIRSGRTNIVVALNNEDGAQRFRDKTFGVMRQLAHGLVNFWEQDRSVNFILSPHTHEDYGLINCLALHMPVEMVHQNVVSTGLVPAQNAQEFYDLYRHVDLILAMRIHAMSPAIGLGTPMIALSSQKRMTEFMKDAGLESDCVDIFNPHLSGLLYGMMESKVKYHYEIKEKFRKSYNLMRHKTWRFNQKIYDFIKEAL